MNAMGEHLLVRIPKAEERRREGIVLPQNLGVEFMYGRVLSVGARVDLEFVDDEGKLAAIRPGDFVAFDHLGARELTLDPVSDEGLFSIHETQVFARVTEEELGARNVPMPAA